MGDGLVKWRMAKIPTVVELVSQLPKEEMSELQFRNEMKHSIYGEGFIRTAYQLACQLASDSVISCVNLGIYFPLSIQYKPN